MVRVDGVGVGKGWPKTFSHKHFRKRLISSPSYFYDTKTLLQEFGDSPSRRRMVYFLV